MSTRIEKDFLGQKEIPADAYYGVQTARALENFQISGVAINHYPGFIEGFAIVKLAAARAKRHLRFVPLAGAEHLLYPSNRQTLARVRAAELADWQNSGGDFLSSALTRQTI